MNNNKNSDVSKSWFCVFNNPEDHGFTGKPEDIVDAVIQRWIDNNPQRTCAVAYCISADGLKHLHAVLEDVKAMRFTAVKKVFPKMHIEPTKGNKQQADDYINKRGKFKEDGEQVIYVDKYGSITGAQGKRTDLEIAEELLNQERSPNEIFDMSIKYRRYEKSIRDHYFRKRYRETPKMRDMNVYWHVGKSGSGKSYEHIKLEDEHGEDQVYYIGEFSNGFDRYNGESILFMDELRAGLLDYARLLRILDKYKTEVKARYTNVSALWSEVHITSVYPPDILYRDMVKSAEMGIDSYQQLRRRITYIVYHYIDIDGKYRQYQLPMENYTDYKQLIKSAEPQNEALTLDKDNPFVDTDSNNPQEKSKETPTEIIVDDSDLPF